MKRPGLAGKLAGAFIHSKLTPLLVIASVLLGVFAVIATPREEEPQIKVPMVDIFVQMPGATAAEVEQRVTTPMEKLLWEIPGVEYIYSTSSPGMALAIIRFKVGQNTEESLVKVYNKMYSHLDRIPSGASHPLIKPRLIDDVPILALTLHSSEYDPFTLRRIAAQVEDAIKQVNDVSETTLIGGQRRQIRVVLDSARMASRGVGAPALMGALSQANQQVHAGSVSMGNREYLVEAGSFLSSAAEVGSVVVGSQGQRPIFLRDVAMVIDGPEEPANYVLFGRGAGFEAAGSGHGSMQQGVENAVTIAISKRKSTNAAVIAEAVLRKVDGLKGTVIPADVAVAVTRDYGETATEKSNELLKHMAIAVISVTLLIALALGWRESGVVAVAIPGTLALTLFVFYLYGYTLNRITLFALIFSIGILVDDAIVVVENIVRHMRMPGNRGRSPRAVAIEAVDEVGNPTILATFTVIAAILPMAFVGGLMGPYMRPIPVGATAAMIWSLLIAFIVTPWAALKLLKKNGQGHEHSADDWTTRLYRQMMTPLIQSPLHRWAFLGGVAFLLLGAVSLIGLKFVAVKMLPFDNKNEFQVIVDMPDGTTLEQTTEATRALAGEVAKLPEVTDYQIYAGTAAPFNFNGLVRHYYLRQGAKVADIQVNLLPKHERKAQSHAIARRAREVLLPIAEQYGARIKVAEVPPGPPVLSTLVAEVYGPDPERRRELARQVKEVFLQTEGVVDVDWYVEDDQPKRRYVVDKEKAALNGISTGQVAQALRMAVGGTPVGLAHLPAEKEDVQIFLRLPQADRSDAAHLAQIPLQSPSGVMVPLGELVRVEDTVAEKSLYHKNLMPVTYVIGDVAGREESPVYPILKMKRAIEKIQIPEGYQIAQYTARQPFAAEKYAMKWDGEWHITYEVFRDLGIAFAAVLVLIYILVVGWFQSFITPLVIMAPIPLTLVGILPAHGLMGAFFTATSMIGFIAGAGIIVRNSIILVDFIELRLRQGMPLAEAVIDAGAVRFRPMLLTAAAVVVGAAVILFDPIFQGLAISLMAGEIASTLLSRMAVPVLYYMVNSRGHKGLAQAEELAAEPVEAV
jgi:multidrug efflux pump subunit AcrB